ncbi:tRNA-specific adenosine deaminase [Desulfamplus magnetovallimortis]|uniref:tRNA-specific adenosine deaminase n=1 Tax=Desulfamplus magnetovallimortis TaxID=1246637 RepID=A0A1W1H721_9BACT|nr:tRNA adenosine(34) deaminase TadA [Desulfamplus magnetovallimortis]SLM28244.1 tRNA-specific adenosine deaminase [Desulfamplus magnetovallimortis]
MDDRYYMLYALEQAKKAILIDEVPVGAVIIDNDGTVIGLGHNRPISMIDPTAHAEIEAIRMAADATGNYRLTGAILYVTIEPCIMCMGAIIHARIARVVYGAPDPKWGGAGSLYNFASDQRLNHNLEITSGVCLNETREIIKSFFRNKRSK